MFKKILVAFDASDHSIRALDQAVQLAHHSPAKIVLLHVINYPVQYLDMGLVMKDLPISKEKIDQIGSQIMQLAVKSVDLEGIDVTMKTVAGRPASSIVEESKNGFDLIIMGTMGHSPLGGALVGSVTQRVLGKATCPVLVVK